MKFPDWYKGKGYYIPINGIFEKVEGQHTIDLVYIDLLDPNMDLLEYYYYLPIEVQDILVEFGEAGSYDRCRELYDILEPYGLTFEWGLDACPIELKYKI